MKDAALILLYALLIIISGVIIAAVSTGDISVFAIICPILILIVVPWFFVVRKNLPHREEFPQGKLSSDDEYRWIVRYWKNAFKFIILPCLIAIIVVIIFAIVVAVTS